MNDACSTCPWARIVERQATQLLDQIIAGGHMDRGILVVELSASAMEQLAAWRAVCDDCECGEAMGDGPEPFDYVLAKAA